MDVGEVQCLLILPVPIQSRNGRKGALPVWAKSALKDDIIEEEEG